MWDSKIRLDQLDELLQDSDRRAHRDRARQNWEWLQAHWSELTSRAHGKFLAVAGQEAFVAESLPEALAWVRAMHPDDTGHIVEFVPPPAGPRIYSGTVC